MYSRDCDNVPLLLFLVMYFTGSPQPAKLVAPSLGRDWFILHQFLYVSLSQTANLAYSFFEC